MKSLVLVGLLVAATAQPADACGVAVFGSSSSESAAPIEPPPPPPEPQWGLKIFGGLIVVSVMTRWMIRK